MIILSIRKILIKHRKVKIQLISIILVSRFRVIINSYFIKYNFPNRTSIFIVTKLSVSKNETFYMGQEIINYLNNVLFKGKSQWFCVCVIFVDKGFLLLNGFIYGTGSKEQKNNLPIFSTPPFPVPTGTW